MSVKQIIKQVKNTNDLLYLALLSLYSRTNDDHSKRGAKQFILPEIVYLLDEKSLVNLVTYFGGETIAIPKSSELKDQLYGILAYYYFEVEGIKDWKSIAEKMNLPYSEKLGEKLKELSKGIANSLEDVRLLSGIPNKKSL